MLRLLLNAHHNICVPKELAYFERCARHGLLDAWEKPGISEETYRDFVHAFLNKKKLALEGVDLGELENRIIACGAPKMDMPFRMALEAWAMKEKKGTWGEKTPKNLFYVDVIHEMIPNARFIYLVRDPRAVVYSMNRFQRFEDDSVLNAFNWLQAATKGYNLLKQSVPEQKWMVLKYEELAEDVSNTAQKICAFLDEPFDEKMLHFYRQSQTMIHPHSSTLGGVHTLTKPVSTVSIDKWRDGLSPREISSVESVCRGVMNDFGYTPIGQKLGPVDEFNVSLKLKYCQWQQRRNKHMRAYQIAFKPFGKTRMRLRRLLAQ